MKKILSISLLIAVSFSSSAELKNGGLHSGSIRDYVPNISYNAFYTDYYGMSGPVNSKTYEKLFNHIRGEYIESTVKDYCKKQDSKDTVIYYGVDNISFSQKQILSTHGEYGESVYAVFTVFCAS